VSEPVFLHVIDTADIVGPGCLFVCANYACKLSARSCVERQSFVRQKLRLMEFGLCGGGNCTQGADVARLSGLTNHENAQAVRERTRQKRATKKQGTAKKMLGGHNAATKWADKLNGGT
jgi:hypothetical protein